MSISFTTTGSFEKTESFLRRMTKNQIASILESYGAIGTTALKSATPVDTGMTASAWTHKVTNKGGVWELSWHNQNGSNGVKIALLLQYGHGTGTGGYVSGRDYINPAIRPIFDKISNDVWREVTGG